MFRRKTIDGRELKGLLKKYKQLDIKLLVLFGSYLNSPASVYEDVDIAFLSGSRFSQGSLEELVVDFMQLFNCNRINLVDLFYETKPTLIQYEIFATGKPFFEDAGYYFEKVKLEVLNKFKGDYRDSNKLILVDKLEKLKVLVSDLSDVYDFYIHNEKLRSYLKDAYIKKASDVVDSALRFNKFLLRRYCEKKISNSYQNFLDAAIFLRMAHDIAENLAKTSAFPSILNIDYLYGPKWSIDKFVKLIVEFYPVYFKQIDEFAKNN